MDVRTPSYDNFIVSVGIYSFYYWPKHLWSHHKLVLRYNPSTGHATRCLKAKFDWVI